MKLLTPAHRVNVARLLGTDEPDVETQFRRIQFTERNFGLPVKTVVVVVLFYVLFFSGWFQGTNIVGVQDQGQHAKHALKQASMINTAGLILLPAAQEAFKVVQHFFLGYVLWNLASAAVLLGMARFPYRAVRWVVLANTLVDALLLSALTMMTGGYSSFLFWVFLVLIVRNAIILPSSQIVLNLVVTACYVIAGFLFSWINAQDEQFLAAQGLDVFEHPIGVEVILLRLALLLLMTACCYGVQVLLDKQQRADEEAREFAMRQEQLRSAGRLAAEIAHQIKNPLGIINNAAFTLQRTLKEGKGTVTQQIRIIREEVERSDRILTELMGYAQLAEGKVERLDVIAELDHAISQVFPPAAQYDVRIERAYAPALPPLMLQRGHLLEIFKNILQNAREAMNGSGEIRITVALAETYSIVVTIADNGPGIPPELRERIFEAYFSTKDKGSGLGLAIVRHNLEMYGGSVRVESELGQGTRFVLCFPARTMMKLRR